MRAPPVNLSTPGATPELVIIDSRKRLELLNHFSFLGFLQQRIAMKAAREWRSGREKLKSTDHFDGLFGGFLRTRVIAMLHNRVHQEAAVAGKQRAVFALHYFEELMIFGGIQVCDVEAEQTQIAGQFSEMAVGDKSFDVILRQAFVRRRRMRKANRIYFNYGISLQYTGKINGHSFDKNQIHLWVRHPARFDHVFNRCPLVQHSYHCRP